MLFLIALASPVSHADVTITLDEFITTILSNNPGVQRILEQEAIAAGQLESRIPVPAPVSVTAISIPTALRHCREILVRPSISPVSPYA